MTELDFFKALSPEAAYILFGDDVFEYGKEPFCTNCGERVSYTVSEVRKTVTKKATTFSYNEIHAKCKKCNEPIYVPLVNDVNVLRRELAFNAAKRKRLKVEAKGEE